MINDINLERDDYTVQFFHQETASPNLFNVAASVVAVFVRPRTIMRAPILASVAAAKTITWFRGVEQAAIAVLLAREIAELYQLWREYRWTVMFARMAAARIFPAAIAAEIVVQALFAYLEYALKSQGYKITAIDYSEKKLKAAWDLNPPANVLAGSFVARRLLD